MKDKIIMLVIGILIGAVIASACFLLFAKTGDNKMPGGERLDMGNFVPDGGNFNKRNGNSITQNTEQSSNSNESI